MDVKSFDFHLPSELIAQTPLGDRSASRLMVLDPVQQTIEHRHFVDILDYVKPGDVLVRNNTQVIPARLLGIKEGTGAHVELLLLHQEGDEWHCLVGNAKTVHVGTIIRFGDGQLRAQCVAVLDEGLRRFKMIYHGVFMEVLDQLGHVPLPPYIKTQLSDPSRYQTVYAKVQGSAASPTAGLHFTESLFEQMKAKGIQIVDVTLHIGLGTFRPVKVERVEDHPMHSEFYQLSEQAANQLNEAKRDGRRIIAIGTTSTRVLETNFSQFKAFQSTAGWTTIFIYPGYEFKAIDALITNFHLPQSTLLMLVAAFAGHDFILKAYHEAVQKQYRFFSFGDSMLLQRRAKK